MEEQLDRLHETFAEDIVKAMELREQLASDQLSQAERKDLEAQLMSLPTGMQDHYAALLGGLLEIEHRPGGEVARHLSVDLDHLGRHLTVVFSGQSHLSAASNWQVVRRRLDGDGESRELFDGIATVAAALSKALEEADLERVGKLMSQL